MILYIAGPITSDMDGYKQKFNAAEFYLSECKNHIVLNPAVHPLGMDYENYLKIDMAMLDCADGIVMLRGWKNSPGAKRELKYAMAFGKKIFYGIESVPFAEVE